MPESEKFKNFDDIKCLWMKCGAVEYKICDKNFECENCEFDKLIVSRLKRKGNIHEEIKNMFDLGQHEPSFSHPHYHFNGGLVVKNFLGNNYYLGLEPFIVKFIDRLSSVNYSTESDSIKKGDQILNIKNGWGEVNVLSPFALRYVEKLELNNIFSKDAHWFAIIETERHEILSNSINEKIYYEKLHQTKIYIKESMKTSEMAGATMYDGGTALENWSEILGKSTYKNLMTMLFT
jgi:hypothetical protein